jgi:hypothetical protein
MKIFLVDAVSTFRNSYVIRCKNEEHAADSVTLNEAEEFSQEWLGESISRIREITEDDYLFLFDKDNEYLKDWNVDQKKRLIHTVDYDKKDYNLVDDIPKSYDPLSNGKAEI